ncbi:UNVERIFIED_CONTAM: ribosomal protein S18 acetylase RimI-like enzyme [Brevibacillus sp. OAP136]
MTSFIVRPIKQEEWEKFAAIGCAPEHVAGCQRYLEQMLAAGSMRIDWCFVAEEAGQLIGRIASWTLPSVGKPLDFVLIDLPWEREDYLAIGSALVQEVVALVRSLGGEQVGHVLDTPAVSPQWQHHPERRQALLSHLGFQVERKTNRFEWNSAVQGKEFDSRSIAAQKAGELQYRSLEDVGQDAFVQAVMRVSEGTFDQFIREERERLGALEQANSFFTELQHMTYEPNWWQLAYTPAGELVGLIMPTQTPGFATIGYIGVVPEQRGKGYVHALLYHGTRILLDSGAVVIRTDTDIDNVPMAQAFLAAGYHLFTLRSEYLVKS